jgi:hypothetical protein
MRPTPGKTRPGLRKGGINRNSACQKQEGSCRLATCSGTLTVWKSVVVVVLAAPPGSDWCGERREDREERRGHSAAVQELEAGGNWRQEK